MKRRVAVLLHDVRSTHNVGSIFRSADAAGVSRMYLCGFTPTPTDRFGRVQKDIAKTALGAEKFLAWEHHASALRLISKLQKEGWDIVAVEQDKRSIDYQRFDIKKPTLFIFGNEVQGLPKNILKRCDAVVEIPMRGKKESLNVSVVVGIVLFRAVNSH